MPPLRQAARVLPCADCLQRLRSPDLRGQRPAPSLLTLRCVTFRQIPGLPAISERATPTSRDDYFPREVFFFAFGFVGASLPAAAARAFCFFVAMSASPRRCQLPCSRPLRGGRRATGERIRRHPGIAAILVTADVNRALLIGEHNLAELLRASKRRSTEMTMNLDRRSPPRRAL